MKSVLSCSPSNLRQALHGMLLEGAHIYMAVVIPAAWHVFCASIENYGNIHSKKLVYLSGSF